MTENALNRENVSTCFSISLLNGSQGCIFLSHHVSFLPSHVVLLSTVLNHAFVLQAVTNINSLLERADRVYRQLVSHRQPLDVLLNRLLEHGQQEPLQVNFKLTKAH